MRRPLVLVLIASLVSAGALPAGGAPAAEVGPPPSSWVGTARIEPNSPYRTDSTGDLWPSCWAANDNLYTANGDGRGFSIDVPASDIVVNEVRGDLPNLTGTATARADQVGTIWNPVGYNRKPTGMLCAGDTIYLAVQDLAKNFDDVPAATIAKSTDQGRTWTWDRSKPMFDDHTFTTIWFADFGRGNRLAPDGYAYVYGLDGNWRDSGTDAVPDPKDVFLARVPVNRLQDRRAWQFYTGLDSRGRPRWNPDIAAKAPVLTDSRRVYKQRYGNARGNLSVISQGGVTYLPKSKRYLYASWTGPTFELYESPSPWGPWKHFTSRDFGGTPWSDAKHGGYATTIPSKFVSADERTLHIQSNVFCCGELKTVYRFSLRKLELVPADRSPAVNPLDAGVNLATAAGTVAISKSSASGTLTTLNDGTTTVSENDYDDEVKPYSWWGYTWPRQLRLNQVEYTTGEMAENGGWFDGRPQVQVRRDGDWVDVATQSILPVYPGSAAAGSRTPYTITFAPTEADGVRVIGNAGGTRTFTSISELAVRYAAQVTNGGFEAPSGASGWTYDGLAGHGFDRGLGNAHTGANNAWIRTSRTDWSAYTQAVRVVPGRTYTFSGWFRAGSSMPAGAARFGVRLGALGSQVLAEVPFGAASTYQQRQVQVTIPAGVDTVTVYGGFTGPGTDTWFQLDDLAITET